MFLLALMLDVLPPATGAPPAAARPSAHVAEPPRADRTARWSQEEIFAALRVVETGGIRNGGQRAIGDGGKAIGPLQIHRDYWEDSKVPGRFEDCTDLAYARKVVLAYWRRYCPKALDALDAEILARVHNGGPQGDRKESTKAFWRKVERELVRQREKKRGGTLV